MRHGLGMTQASRGRVASPHLRLSPSPRLHRNLRLRLQAAGAAVFYPDDLPARRWLEYASRRFNSIELNGTFYSLKSPRVFERWLERDAGARLRLRGEGRPLHHAQPQAAPRRVGARQLLRERCARARATHGPVPLAAAGHATGSTPSGSTRSCACCREEHREGESVALQHDDRLRRGALVDAAEDVPIATPSRSAIRRTSTRSSSRSCASTAVAFVVADTAGKFPVRRGGDDGLRVRAAARLARAVRERVHRRGARRVGRRRSRRGEASGRDVYVYFDNDAKVHAPYDAMRLAERVGVVVGAPPTLTSPTDRGYLTTRNVVVRSDSDPFRRTQSGIAEKVRPQQV